MLSAVQLPQFATISPLTFIHVLPFTVTYSLLPTCF